MQIKIAFKAIFLVDEGEFSRAEAQSAPQNAMSVSGTPHSITTERKGNGNTGCTRVTGRERRNTRREIAEH